MRRALLVLVLLGLAAAAAAGWWLRQQLVTPYRGFAGDEVFVELPAGASVSTIGRLLTQAGVVPDELTFRVAARLAGEDRRLQAGEYRFADAARPGEVVARLARGDVFTRTVTFPEGRTIAEMGDIFANSGLGTADAFRAAAADPSPIATFDPGAANLEGYLFPDTYSLPRRAGAEGTVAAMVAGFARAFDAQLRAAAAERHLSAHDVVTIASIVEKETAQPDERPIIAAVYENRLARGMVLQCDPTVIYALMLAGRWNRNLSKKDLQIDSPYNTYRYAGLPPGPIASPGRASLEAAVHPADVPYLYFVSKNDGTHAFATTLAEHNRNVAKWQIKYFRNR